MKKLNDYKYIRKRSLLIMGDSIYNEYRIIVKDKWWHRWKVYATSCFPEVIDDIIKKELI